MGGTRHTKQSLTYIAIVSLAVSISGCADSDKSSNDALLPVVAEESESDDALSLDYADQRWAELNRSAERLSLKEGETDLQRFLRQMEFDNRRRRETGLTFWEDFPEDERRYDWLMLTVALPPMYPLDSYEWAAAESDRDIFRNDVEIDESAVAEWQSIYLRLRTEFWEADAVSEKDKRFLWFVEILTRLRLIRSEYSGELVDEVRRVFSEVEDYVNEYDEPFDITDSDHTTAPRQLIGEAIRTAALSDQFSVSYARDFLLNIQESPNDSAAEFAALALDYIEDDADLGFFVSSVDRHNPNDVLQVLKPSVSMLVGVREGVLANSVLMQTERRKFRDIGYDLIQNGGVNREMVGGWLRQVWWHHTTYPVDLIDSYFGVQNGADSASNHSRAEERRWQIKYATVRRQYLEDENTSDEDKGSLREYEVWGEFWLARDAWKREKDEGAVQTSLIAVSTLFEERGATFLTSLIATSIISEYTSLGLTADELEAFFSPYIDHEVPELDSLARAARETANMRQTAVSIELPTMDGEPFSLEQLRGRSVLVDHWATTCASCIAAMPVINGVYEEYKDEGFVVVSIAYDGSSERNLVMRIKDDLGLDQWISLNGEGAWTEVANRYGYQGFPQYMLLNRDGTVYAGTGEVDLGRNLSALLDEMLAAEAEEKEAATVH